MTNEERRDHSIEEPDLVSQTDKAKTLLKRKVEANYAVYKERWLQMQPAELIDRCEELEAVTRMAREIPSTVSDEDAEYLLRFKNPLEVVSNGWISMNGMDSLIVDDEMRHLLWSLQDRGDAEEVYEMEPGSDEESEAPTLKL